MRSDIPSTPRFTTELEAVLRGKAAQKKRTRRPFATAALRRLRSVSSVAGHTGAAVTLSAVLLLLSPATIEREIELPPVAEPPAAGYLAQYGATSAPSAHQTITMAREAGFEVEVITTFVADRAAHGEILGMRHLSAPVATLPATETARGPLLIIIGLSIGESGNTAD